VDIDSKENKSAKLFGFCLFAIQFQGVLVRRRVVITQGAID
jgi:hypothetical protein